MAVVDIKINPTRRDLQVFSLLFLAFMGVLGVMALGRPHALLGMAAFTGAAFVISFALNNDQPRKMQLLGMIIPVALLLIGGLQKVGVSKEAVVGVTWGIGVVGAVIAWVSPSAGKNLYVGWMYAALPLGWTISHVILGVVFYLVITPIGLIMRVLGRDAMARRFDRNAKTYWIEHDPSAGAKGSPQVARYFRQF